jgi:DNA polymerase III delta subunit
VIAIDHGPDALLVRQAVAKIVKAHDPDGTATSRIDGKSTPLPQIIAQVASVGFFGAGRVVVVDDLLARAAKPIKGSDDADSGSIDIGPLFAAVEQNNSLILVDQTLHSVPVAVRKLMPSSVDVVAGEPPRGPNLLRWISATAKSAGVEIDQRAAQVLGSRLYPQTWQQKPNNPRYDVPPDLDRLTQEIEKLAVAALPGSITAEHVERLVAAVADDQLFRFTDALVRRQTRTAVAELEKLLGSGEEPYAIVAQAMQQAELAVVAEHISGKDPVAAGRDLGLSNPARMSSVASSRRGLARGSAQTDLEQALAVDRQVKRGGLRQPEDALYSLIATPQRGE